MATNISDIPNLENQLSKLNKQRSAYQTKLDTSSTALGGSGQPTNYDIFNQESSERIKKEISIINDKIKKTKWYGTDETKSAQEEPASVGVIGKTLDWLSRPLYGLVGATKHLVGQGSGTLAEDMADNIARNKNTFGDVLRTSNVPSGIAAPVGFALDIFLDPVNWATMGTGAFIPKVGYGLYKGVKVGKAVEGIATAAKSGILEKATTIGKYTPFLRKTKAMEKLGEKTVKAVKEWEDFSGIRPESFITQKGMGAGSYRIGLSEVINKVAEKVPRGKEVLDHFIYDPIDWVRQARYKDMLQELLGKGVDTKALVNAKLKGLPTEQLYKEAMEQIVAQSTPATLLKGERLSDVKVPKNLMSNDEVEKVLSSITNPDLINKIEKAAPKLVNGVDDAMSISKNPRVYSSGDPVENSLRIMNERIGGIGISLEELGAIMKSEAMDITGVKWYDKMMKGIRDYTIKVDRNSDKVVKIGGKTMDMYDKGMSLFKVAKIALSPSAWTNAVVGNMIMAHMSGGLTPRLINRLGQSIKMYTNKPGAAAKIDKIIGDAAKRYGNNPDYIRNLLNGELSTASRSTFGSLDFINTNANREKLLQNARDAGKVSASIKSADIAEDMQKAVDELAEVKIGAGTTKTMELIRENKGGFLKSEAGSGQLSNELFEKNAAREMFDHISKKAKEDGANVAWKILDFAYNKVPSGYESIDQSYKMASFLTSIADGYTANQLRQMRHLVNISPEELALGKYTTKFGETLYKLHPTTAIELANVQFLNYAAMPSAVRVLRNLPLIGSPFISFMYGMSLKAGQTLAYNPSAFNKVSFAMNEFSGKKTPLEKKALESSYYSYLKEPGMVRLPFFDENPIYANLANMIPYYSLNMFDPPQAKYGNTTREKLVQLAQGSQLGDPVGKVLFEYLIQPLILGEAIRPQGQFGQPLYPVDATGFEKLGYGARTLGEAFVPNVASYAGLVTPEAVADFIPSYRWRQLAYAKGGKNQMGISSKEPKLNRTIRTAVNAAGIPIQAPVNTTFASKDK